MAKFTILKPPPGQTLAIPTVKQGIINFTFPLDEAVYAVEGENLRLTLPNNITLLLNEILYTAADINNAPHIVLPEQAPLNAHHFLTSVGVSREAMAQAVKKHSATQTDDTPPVPGQVIDTLLASAVDMSDPLVEGPDALENLTRHAWINSSYIIAAPMSPESTAQRAQLEIGAHEITAGQTLKMAIHFHHVDTPETVMDVLRDPCVIYLAITPLAESYDMADFLDLKRLSVNYHQVIGQTWEDNQHGAYLLKLFLGPGNLNRDDSGLSCLLLELPLFDTYLQGASFSVTMVAAVGHDLRVGQRIGANNISIIPNYKAKVMYRSKYGAQVFCLTSNSLQIDPPNIVLRGLNYEAGDAIFINEALQALGKDAGYTFKQQGLHLVLCLHNNDRSQRLRVVLEDTNLEQLLSHDSFANTQAKAKEWLNYIYVTPKYVNENAVPEADVLLTSHTLLNAFLKDEDYSSMQTFLQNLIQNPD